MRTSALIALVLGMFGLCGCMHFPAASRHSMRAPRPEWCAQLARVDSDSAASTVTEVQVFPRYYLWRVELQRGTNQLALSEPIVLEYYQSTKKKNGPVILLLPVAGGDYQIEHHFARYFARRGLSVVLQRRARTEPEDLSDLGTINVWLEQTLAENQRVLDWIEQRPELGTNRLGVFGISLGSIQAVLLSGADNRVRASVFGLSGGDLPYILSHSAEPSIVRRRTAYQRQHHISGEQFEAALRQCILCEPNSVAGCIESTRVLMVLGAFDRVVPFKKGWDLRRRLGRPETIVLPTGHYSAVVFVPYLEHASLSFFRRHLDKNRNPKREEKSY